MARLNNRPADSSDEEPRPASFSSVRSKTTHRNPLGGVDTSDKENRSSEQTEARQRKRKSYTSPMAEQANGSISGSKRIRLEENARTQRSRAALQDELESRVDKKYYDPDQNLEQVRSSKRKYRDLISRLNDSRSEYLQSSSKGIEETLDEADSLYSNVKQTSVATIDSRLLVNVGDLAHKKVSTLTLGDSSTGIDVDDFITKCIYFMKGGADESTAIPSSTQSTQRQQRRRNRNEDDDEDEAGDPMNWAYLGQNACFLYNKRPCLSGFLLGPLSVQKKVRQQTQRRARQTQTNPSQTARPTELGDEDLEKQESANLTVICGQIANLLRETIAEGEQRVNEEYETYEDEPTDQQVRKLLAKNGLTDNGCVPLFNFCVNPKSFGQTVENMFYVSFLIKEGKFGLDFDKQGLPTLGTAQPRSVAERQETQRNQAVFTLDFDMWQELVESFGIKKSIIPHRKEEQWDDGTLDLGTTNVAGSDSES